MKGTLTRLSDPLPLPRPGDSPDTHLHGHRDIPDCSVDHDPQHLASRVGVRVLVSKGQGAGRPHSRAARAGAAGADGPEFRAWLCHLPPV